MAEMDEVNRRARRRSLVTTGIALVVVLGGIMISDEVRGTDRHHYHGIWAVIVPVATVLVICGVLLLGLALWSRRRPERYGAPYYGLEAGDQRRVDRAIRDAEPSADDPTAAVETATARQRLRDGRAMNTIFGLVLVACIGQAIFSDQLSGHVLYGIGAVVAVIMLLQQRRATVASRRYLHARGSAVGRN